MACSSILLRTKHYIVINKPPMCYSQKVGRDINNTVEQLLRGECPSLYDAAVVHPPFCQPKLVHRLDYQTSGAMLLATSATAVRMFSRGQQQRKQTNGSNAGYRMRKKYLALIDGPRNDVLERLKMYQQQRDPNSSSHNDRVVAAIGGTLECEIDGKRATSRYRILEHADPAQTLCLFELQTGRKHQLRIQTSQIMGYPIVGDTKYATANRPKFYAPGPIALHSAELSIQTRPSESWTSVVAPLRDEWLNIWGNRAQDVQKTICNLMSREAIV